MSNEFFDNLFLPDDNGLPMDGLELLEDMELQKENILIELFELPQFFYNVFFACALTERGRKRLRELETASPDLFLTEPFLLLDTYEALYKTGMPEIDRCVKQLLTLYHNETRNDGSPEQTLTVAKAAYPKLYGSCKSVGDAVSIGQLYQKFANVKPEEQDNGIGKDMTSEGVYVICLLFWLYGALHKTLTPFDGVFAMILLEVIYQQTDLYTPTNDLEISKELKRFVRSLSSELNGKTIPCTLLLHSPYADEEQLRLYYRLFAAAGQNIDLGKRLETATIGENELYHLMEIEATMLEPLVSTLVPYLVIKQSLSNEEAIARELDDTRSELAKRRAMAVPEIPVDERLVENEGRIAALREELERVARELKAATNRERGLTAELSKLRRDVKKKDAEIASHKSDRQELAELREALYRISQSQEDNQEASHESGEIVFPYYDLPEGIVCFGGHEQWIGQMQKKLPGVRFVPVNYRYDSSIVKRAPCVWIQPCFLSHKMYFRIINDARSSGVVRHYFHTLSASSSARHLVQTMTRE